jgi:cell division transport system permease protein
MLQLWRILTAGTKNFLRNAWLSTAATAVMTVTLTIIVVSFISNSALTDTVKSVTDKIVLSVYLKETDTPAQSDLIRTRLEATGNVQQTTFITKDEALAKFKEKNKSNPLQLQAIELTGNTLPASYEVHLIDRNKLDDVIKVASQPEIRPLLDDKNPVSISGSRRDAIQNIIRGSNFVIRLGLVASLIFLIISTLIIFNTIRMAIFTRRDEIEIMKLVGATKWFIRGPFLFEATLYGIVGAFIATALAYTLLLGSGPKLSNYIDVQSTIAFFTSYPFLIIGAEIFIGMCIGIFSSLLAMSRYLKL